MYDLEIRLSWYRSNEPIRTKALVDITEKNNQDISIASGAILAGEEFAKTASEASEVRFISGDEDLENYTIKVGDKRLKPPLYEQILDADTVEKAKKMIGLYGPISPTGFDDGSVLSTSSSAFGVLAPTLTLEAAASTKKRIAETYSAFTMARNQILYFVESVSDPDQMSRSVLNPFQHFARNNSEGDVESETGALLELKTIYQKDSGSFRPVFSVSSPLQFALAEIIMGLAQGGRFRRCEHCNRLFGVGANWGRSVKAKYCSESHRSLAYRQRKNAKESSPK